MIDAIVLIEAEPRHIAALGRRPGRAPGRGRGLLGHRRVRPRRGGPRPRHDDLAEVVTHGIATAEGVRRTHTLVAFRTYRTEDYAWDLGAGVSRRRLRRPDASRLEPAPG